ncbi:hypothetical protein FHG87_007917 [Trinorchestia longiramus]|nr:hypothetical protein FHG87_007917 [Trinorchestia longiramus]
MKSLLKTIKYTGHQWQISGDLKVTAIILAIQLGYTKYCFILCQWYSRDTFSPYEIRACTPRKNLCIGETNAQHDPLIVRNIIRSSPLHIELGSWKAL